MTELAGHDHSPGQYCDEKEVKGCPFQRKGWNGKNGAHPGIGAEPIPER
jgi:hypothetical protein